MKKRLLALVIGLVMVFTLAACEKKTDPTPAPTPTPTVAPTPTPKADPTPTPESATPEVSGGDNAQGNAEANTTDVGEDGLVGINSVLLEEPVMLTSVGQSADVSIVETLFKRAGIETDTSATLDASSLRASTKTLVLAVGGSSKGLGAAGIDENQELARVKDLLAKAEELGVQVLAMHIGGSARRGTLSDMFIPASFEAANVAIIVAEGDTDNYMRNMLIDSETPAVYIENSVDSVAYIKQLFGVE